ncbi:MAG: hypothetical protein H5T69_10845 [Chloroflexi bacterium]|nr:hypothetical protein [Chloroflexota bacterium]
MFDTHLDPGSLALLQQAYRNNWQQYLASLAESGPLRPWDLCVLTASNERQAEAYRVQIEARRRAQLLPSGTEFRVIADPAAPDGGGLRIGSGGATLRALQLLADDGALLGGRRVLMIHSGGDSRRLPHCSATGKLFARVPHELPDGRPSSLFDEFLVSLSGLPGQIPAGLLVASGDVLLLFDHLQLLFARPGVTGVAAAAPVEIGANHGIYVSAEAGQRVRAFLHKPSPEEMHRAGALRADGQVQIDTGLVWLDGETISRWLALADALTPYIVQGVTINLYGDLLAPLAEDAELEPYLADESDGPATAELREARRTIWAQLRGLPFGVEKLHPALFVHFGTTAEYLEVMRQGITLGWSRDAASWVSPAVSARSGCQWAAVNAYVDDGDLRSACLLDALIEGQLVAQEEGLVAHLATARPRLELGAGVALDQIPLRDGRYITRLYGVADDPKRPVDGGGTFLNVSWRQWLDQGLLSAQDLWPGLDDPAERTLWNAHLYPVCESCEASLEAVLWLQEPAQAQEEEVRRWREAERLSLHESYLQADVGRMVALEAEIEDRVRARRFCAGLERERPAEELAGLLGQAGDAPRRARLVADWLEASIDSWLPIRGYLALARALDRHPTTRDPRWEQRAFSSLARLVRAHTGIGEIRTLDLDTLPREVTVRLPARIDFAGGWTDTPPYSLERGGTVLNAAFTLRGERPILAQATFLDEPILELESLDIGSTIRPRLVGEILNYANPADPFALLKAALVFRGLVPADANPHEPVTDMLKRRGFGLRLTTATSIPRGSGLGTSSILAGAVLQALARLLGQAGDLEADETRLKRLFDEVLCLEQMITTGGGWQDQIGGLTDGIKLITTRPGLPQVAHIEPVPLSPALRQALDTRLGLVYTGQRRLAKDLLRHIMARWMARDPEMVYMLEEIARLARAMHRALLNEDLETFGELMAEHWQINKRMDPGCTNLFIDELLHSCRPYLIGAKLAGAGGGGFAIVVARDEGALLELEAHLRRRYPGGQVALWPGRIP